MKPTYFHLLVCCILTSFGVSAQQLPLGSHYFMNPFMINPAYTGTTDNINVFLTHRSQFSGISGAPQTTYLTLDAPTNIKGVGLGLKAYSDVTSILSRNGVSGNYSYSLNLGNSQQLSFGLAAGIIDNTINYDQAVVRDVDDPSIFNQRVHRTVFSADFGVAYSWKQLQVGFAIPQLLSNQSRNRSNDGTISYFDMQQHYVGTAKYVFEIEQVKGLTAYPMVMVRGVAGAPVQYDVNAVVDWNKWGWIALTYRSNYAVGMSVGFRYKQLSVGYAHDFGVSKIRSYAGGTHEFLLSYQFENEAKKKLAQHDRELAELREQTALNEEKIAQVEVKVDQIEEKIDRIEDELTEIRKEENKLYHSVELRQHEIDSLYDLLNSLSKEKIDSNALLTNVRDYRVLKSADFLDENGKPLPNGYYVVIGSFSIKDNAMKFRNERQEQGEVNATIAFHKSISIYNVYVLYSIDYVIANEERNVQTSAYANTWVLKLE